MLVSTGERISMSLLVMALADLGVEGESFTGSQVGIITDNGTPGPRSSRSRATVREALAAGKVPVVAGFQGMSREREITILGRGGSDATAVALAAVLDADVCEIYTDVTGVFTADPRIVPEAHRISRISFDEMLEMAATGGRVLMLRAVEFARNHNVPLHVRGGFLEPGTWVVEEDADMEDAVVTAVTHDTSEAKVTVSGVADHIGVAGRLFRALADKSINVDMIVQNTSVHGTTDISFTVPTDDLPVAVETSQAHANDLGATGVTADADVARVSLVGVGMKSHPGIAATMFETLANEGINIDMISTSTIRTSSSSPRATWNPPSVASTGPSNWADATPTNHRPHCLAASACQNGGRSAAGRHRLRSGAGASRPSRRDRIGSSLYRIGRGATSRAAPRASTTGRPRLSGRPHNGDRGTRDQGCERSPRTPFRGWALPG